MGARSSSAQHVWDVGGTMRDTFGQNELVRSNVLARASRGLNRTVQAERDFAANRSIARSGVRPPNSLLRWAQTTPGAGHAARRLYRDLPGREREQRATWAREVFSRSQARSEIAQADVMDALDSPHLIRSLVALRRDTSWLRWLLDAAAEAGDRRAVEMLVLDDPPRAPPSEHAVELAARHGHFDLALMLLDRSYGVRNRMHGVLAVQAGCRRRHVDLSRVAPLVLRIIQDTEPMYGGCTKLLESIGASVAGTIDPAAFQFKQLADHEHCLFAEIVFGAVLAMLQRASESDAAMARLQLWMVSDPQAATRAAGHLIELPAARDAMLASGLLDMAYDAGYVNITNSDIVLNHSVLVWRGMFPELGAWAATKEAAE